LKEPLKLFLKIKNVTNLYILIENLEKIWNTSIKSRLTGIAHSL